MKFSQFRWRRSPRGTTKRLGAASSALGPWAAMVERLETRVMLAANITASVNKGILTITGSAEADQVTLEPGDQPGTVRISVDGGTVNNLTSVELSGLTKDIRAFLAGGNDQIFVQNFIGGHALPKNLTIEAGDGADVIDLQNVHVNGVASLNSGAGNDNVWVDDSLFVKKVSVDAAEGDDGVLIDRRTGFAGSTQFNHKLSVLLGAGTDVLRVGIDGDASRRASVSRPASINGGTETDTIAISTQSQITAREKLVEGHVAATLPTVTLQLANDTGPGGTTNDDHITSDPSLEGTVSGFTAAQRLIGGFDPTPVANFVDLSSFVQPNGTFLLSETTLTTLFPGVLNDGTHTFSVQVTDTYGESSALVSLPFTLSTAVVTPPTLNLSTSSDTGSVGDSETLVAVVTLTGNADPLTTVSLLETGATTTASVSGVFQFSNVALVLGQNTFTARAENLFGGSAQQSVVITRLDEPVTADVVLDWNNQTLAAIQRDGSSPLIASRILAMASLAVFDAVSAFDGAPGFYVSLPVPVGASLIAAVAGATERILTHEYPTQEAILTSQLLVTLASVPDGQSETDGLNFGRAVADAILAIREQDGSRNFETYIPGTGPGKWQPTAPMVLPAVGAHWAGVTPFVIADPNDFLPDGPPALDSAEWSAEFNQVKELGAADSLTRTADQTQIARFWSDGQGTYTPPGHWNEIAQQVAITAGNSTAANARMFAMLNLAMMDAGIVAFDAKFEYEFWRPITAIQQADTDGNAATIVDIDWQPLLSTPAFPEYLSGHSTFSGAAAEVLTSLFGDGVPFSSMSIGLPNVTRNYTGFEQAAEEAGLSRIYGGIHFLSADLDGLATGQAVGTSVIEAFAGIDTQPPRIVVNEYPRVSDQNITLTGRVLDTVSGVVELTAAIDSTPPVSITFDPNTGAFSLPLNLATNGSGDGLHHIVLVARDAVGNATDPVDLTFSLDTSAPTLVITSPTANGQITEGLRLTGTVDGTDSAIVALTYAFDAATPSPISHSGELGAFDTALNLSLLTPGAHVLHVSATDAAGHVTTADINLTLAAALPLTIVDMDPLHNASEIGTGFRPKFTFSRPANPATLIAANFSASVSGQSLAFTVVQNDDATVAWMFFDDPLPGGASVQITVNGSGILGTDGVPLDADGDGTAGGTLVNTFRTVSTTGVPGTTIAGYVLDPGPDQIPHDFDDVRAGPDGIISTDDDVYLLPLEGVKVFVAGMEEQAVFTDATGHFVIDPAPTGNVKLVFQRVFATNAPTGFYFPEMVMDMESIPGIENWAMEEMPEFYLPRISTTVLHPVSNTEPTIILLESIAGLNLTAEQAALVSMTVYPHSAVDESGQVMDDVQVGISVVAADYVRMMLPNGVNDVPFSFTVQAPGVTRFTTPVALTLPNTFGATPGSQLQFISYDHATGLMAVERTMTVSADGTTITTDPGFGITHPGWHFPGPPIDDPPDDEDPPPPPADAKSKSIPPTQPGNNEHVLMYFPNTFPNPLAIRLRSDDGGHFESIVPGGEDYQIYIYDPGSGLIATGMGTTPSDASQFDPTVGLSLHVSTAPDSDGDGLPDDAEFAIGTVSFDIDTDDDGINDLIEVQRNLDPLTNRPLTVGVTASLALRGEAKEIVVAGGVQNPLEVTGFVATGNHGLAIVDLSEFRRPILLSELDLPGDATDVAADLTANIAVVASNAGGLHFINISDPLHPVLIRTLNVNASQVEISDGFVYATVGGQLRSFDEVTGDQLQVVTPGGGTITGLARDGTLLYTMDTGRLLRVIDTAGLTMTLRGSLTLPHGAGKLTVSGGVAYAVASNSAGFDRGGFATVDLSNPNSLALISGSDIVSPFVAADNAVAVNGSGLVLMVGTPNSAQVLHSLEVYDISDLTTTNTLLQRFVFPQEPHAVTIGAGIAFVADGAGGLQIVNYRAFDAQGIAPTAFISTTVTDVAPGTPGTQIVEGSSIPINITANDDVQVRSVELLVNGIVDATDVQAPSISSPSHRQFRRAARRRRCKSASLILAAIRPCRMFSASAWLPILCRRRSPLRVPPTMASPSTRPRSACGSMSHWTRHSSIWPGSL